jgi:hypothetical protein
MADKMTALGKPKYRPKMEFRTTNSKIYDCRVELDSYSLVIFYFNTAAFSTMLPATKAIRIKNLIVDILQLMYFGTKSQNLDREFLFKLM